MNQLIDKARDFYAQNKKLVLLGAGVLVVLILLLCLCCSRSVTAGGTDSAHGVEWTLYSDGTLEFTGEGEVIGLSMSHTSDADVAEQPAWYTYRGQITAIKIGRSIRRVGADAFVGFDALERMTVRGANTELDIECIRYETAEGWEHYARLTIAGLDGSQAQSYAEFNALAFERL